MENKFPRKKFGSLSEEQILERQAQLAGFFEELMTMILSEEDLEYLKHFLEVSAHVQSSSSTNEAEKKLGNHPIDQAMEEEPSPQLDRHIYNILYIGMCMCVCGLGWLGTWMILWVG